ncbi:hypothetical protein H072_8727 [Dactylellina haptotyla CBS 200.50]|uniref:Uncharacterized protein n=1 Tax=Dactylellina haptotyla (strain CBS 200.50) TaxID=1284197 RepID=S8A902_DACHA|nr:hypothetical protein H072_8727 [Dactylellina haptotyla CBS 200.50]
MFEQAESSFSNPPNSTYNFIEWHFKASESATPSSRCLSEAPSRTDQRACSRSQGPGRFFQLPLPPSQLLVCHSNHRTSPLITNHSETFRFNQLLSSMPPSRPALPMRPVQHRPPLFRANAVTNGAIKKPAQRKPASKGPALAQPRIKLPYRVRFGHNSASPWVFDKTQTFRWGTIQLVEDDKIIRPQECVAQNPPAGRTAVLAIPPTMFRVISQIATDTQELFPGENEVYWKNLEGLKANLERACRQLMCPFEDNLRYYQYQNHLVQSTAKALCKTLNGFFALQRSRKIDSNPEIALLALKAKSDTLISRLPLLQCLRSTLYEKNENRRRHELSMTILSRSKSKQPLAKDQRSMPQETEVLATLVLLIQGVDAMIMALWELRRGLAGLRARYYTYNSTGLIEPPITNMVEVLNHPGNGNIKGTAQKNDKGGVVELLGSYLDLDHE